MNLWGSRCHLQSDWYFAARGARSPINGTVSKRQRLELSRSRRGTASAKASDIRNRLDRTSLALRDLKLAASSEQYPATLLKNLDATRRKTGPSEVPEEAAGPQAVEAGALPQDQDSLGSSKPKSKRKSPIKAKKKNDTKTSRGKAPEEEGRLVLPRFKDKEALKKTKEEFGEIEEERASAKVKRSQSKRKAVPELPEEVAKIVEHIAEESEAHGDIPAIGLNYYCSKDTPQWFAVQVDQPDPSQASKVAFYLRSAQLPMYITLPSGEQIVRSIQVLNPQKKVTVPGRRPGKTSQKTVTWQGGLYIFLQAIMDYELVKYMQPFFVEETQHWFKVLRKKPVAPLMVKFVDGMVLRKKFFIPRPVKQEMLDEVQEWLQKEETWTKDQLIDYESGAEPRNKLMDAQDMVKDLDMFAEDQVDPRVVTAEAQERKRRIEKIELAEASRKMWKAKLEAVSKLDPGAWNVGVAELKRKKRVHTGSSGRGERMSFNRTKFAVKDRLQREEQDAAEGSQRNRNGDPIDDFGSWYVGSQPSLDRLAGDHVAEQTRTSKRKASSYPIQQNDQDRSTMSRGLRRATNQNSEVATRSGWYPSRDDHVGLEEKDGWDSFFGEDGEIRPEIDAEFPAHRYLLKDNDRHHYEAKSAIKYPQSQEDDTISSNDNSWYEGSENPNYTVEGKSNGWYDAASAASSQYSRPTPGANAWYEGPTQEKLEDDTLSDFDASAWKTWQEGGDDQSAEIYAAADLLRNPESNNDWYGTQDADSEWAASKLEQQPGDDLYPTEGVVTDVPFDNTESESYEPSRSLFYGNPDKAKGSSSSSISDSDGSWDKLDDFQGDGARRNDRSLTPKKKAKKKAASAPSRKSSKASLPAVSPDDYMSEMIRTNPLYEWDDSSPDSLPLLEGNVVNIVGGRFKGKQGTIVAVRQGVVRVQMPGAEGPVETDMAAVHCQVF